MAIGPFIRRALGPLGNIAAESYRRIFVDLDALASYLKANISSDGLDIVEVGCGEGMFTSRLSAAYPGSRITGIDIAENAGKMFKGDPLRCSFMRQTIGDLASRRPGSADLVVIVDVMHHIPEGLRRQFLADVGKVLKRGGCIMLKDWTGDRSPVHLLAHFSDRYITGDRVCYKTAGEWKVLLKDVFGQDSIEGEMRIGPWQNNVVFLVRPRL